MTVVVGVGAQRLGTSDEDQICSDPEKNVIRLQTGVYQREGQGKLGQAYKVDTSQGHECHPTHQDLPPSKLPVLVSCVTASGALALS